MKKITTIVLTLGILISTLGFYKPAHAATHNVTGGTNGPLCNSGGYFTPSSITVVDGDTVTFSVPSDDPYAGGIQINGLAQGSLTVTPGNSVTTAALHASVSYQGTWPNEPACIKGSGTITIQAAASPPPASPSPNPSASPTPSSSSTRKTTTPPSPTPTPSPSSTNPTATPLTVVADTVAVDSTTIKSRSDLSVNQGQSVVLTGHTVPNGQVTLTIHSNPQTASVTADGQGNWSYTIPDLEPGTHTVDAVVTDPTTKQTSPSAKLLSFIVNAKPVVAITAQPAKKSPMLVYGLSVLLIVVMGALGFWLKKRSKKDTPAAPPSPPIAPDQPSQNQPPQTPNPNQPL